MRKLTIQEIKNLKVDDVVFVKIKNSLKESESPEYIRTILKKYEGRAYIEQNTRSIITFNLSYEAQETTSLNVEWENDNNKDFFSKYFFVFEHPKLNKYQMINSRN